MLIPRRLAAIVMMTPTVWVPRSAAKLTLEQWSALRLSQAIVRFGQYLVDGYIYGLSIKLELAEMGLVQLVEREP